MNDPHVTPPSGRRKSRQSRYIRAQERRDAQKRADQRFYQAIFSIITVCVLIVLGLAALASNGAFNAQEGGGADLPLRETTLGLTGIEWIGLAVVAVIALFMWRRITKR